MAASIKVPMAFILSAQRNVDDLDVARSHWRRYEAYLHDNANRFPAGALALATGGWYFGFEDHRAPHDAWLESAVFVERSEGEREERRWLVLELTLLGAWQDMWIKFRYPRVYSYAMTGAESQGGHGDWLYDEFRISDNGHLIHEIEWAGGALREGSRWLIESSDVEFSVEPREVT
jgi:hypothetical protein